MQIASTGSAPRPPLSARQAKAPASKPSAPAQPPAAEEARPGLLDGIGNFFKGIGEFLFGRTQDDSVHDGQHSLQAYQSADDSPEERQKAERAHTRSTVLFVNGAGSDLADSEGTARLLAQKLGRDVELIHNATAVKKSEGGLLSGLQNVGNYLEGGSADVNQVANDHHGVGANPAVDEVKAELARRLAAGESVDLVGHSAGNNVIARATRELAAEHPELADRMGNLHILNMAGPTRQEDYAPGIRYAHVETEADFVPQTLGETMADPARRAETYDFFASPAMIFLGFLTHQDDSHSPARILSDPTMQSRVDLLLA